MEYDVLSPPQKRKMSFLLALFVLGACGILLFSFPRTPEPVTQLRSSYPAGSYYVVTSQTPNPQGLSAVLTYQIAPHEQEKLRLAEVISPLQLTVTIETDTRVRVTITDAGNTRWRPPFATYTNPGSQGPDKLNISLAATGQPFSLSVTRISDGKAVLNIDPASLQFNNYEITWNNNLGYPVSVAGLGERVSTFPLGQGVYTLFARDSVSPWDDGLQPPGKNLYGVHPFYLALDTSGAATGGFLYNSNAMNVYVNPNGVTYQTTGGVIDYWAFVGPEPQDVISQYHNLIGLPTLVPFWSFGWHQCRWGISNTSELEQVYYNYDDYEIPLDVVWNDIDYLLNKADFTVDPINFAGLIDFIAALHKDGRRYVPILDGGVAQNSSVFVSGAAQNVFIQDPNNAPNPFIGKVWPGPAAWVDWFHPNATSYWQSNLDHLRNGLSIKFDGLWLDMNEISNFCVGECYGGTLAFPMSTLDFVPGGDDLNTQTVDLGAIHYPGTSTMIEFNTHSLYGFMMANATSQYFTQTLGQRPFIISRSTFPGEGTFASHWLGDNWSNWTYLEASIGGVFNFHMFGIPMVGADICGFLNDTTEELCARWMQLGTLYPFARNHNNESSIDQYPWSFGSKLLYTSMYTIRLRYALLGYYYSLMYETALNGGAWWQPAFFLYPNDTTLVSQATKSFMIGDALIVHPVLQQGVTTISAYFPADIWYDFFIGSQLSSSGWTTLTDNLPGVTNIHIRGGSIVPKLDAASSATTTNDLRQSTVTLIVASDGNITASGFMYLDDGLSVNSISAANYTKVQFYYKYISAQHDVLSITTPAFGYTRAAGEFPYISSIVIYGCLAEPQDVYLSRGSVTTLLNVYTTFQAATKVCAIEMGTDLPPDVTQTVIIDYFGSSEEKAEKARVLRNH